LSNLVNLDNANQGLAVSWLLQITHGQHDAYLLKDYYLLKTLFLLLHLSIWSMQVISRLVATFDQTIDKELYDILLYSFDLLRTELLLLLLILTKQGVYPEYIKCISDFITDKCVTLVACKFSEVLLQATRLIL